MDLPELIPSPSVVREKLARNYEEAGLLRRLLKLAEDAAEKNVRRRDVSSARPAAGKHWYLHNSQFFVTCSVARDWAAFNRGGSLVNFSVTMDRPQCEGPPHNEGSGEISTRAEGVVAHGVILLLHVDLENRIPRGLTLT